MFSGVWGTSYWFNITTITLRTERSIALPGFPKYELVHYLLFGKGGELGVEQQFPSTMCHSWLLPQLATTVVVLLSVEHSRTTTKSSELEIYMHVGNLWSQLFVNKMEVTVQGLNHGREDIFSICPDWPWGPPRLLHNGYRVSFLGIRQPDHGTEHQPISSVLVKESIALKQYSSSGLSWPVLGRILLFYESSGDVDGCYWLPDWFLTQAFQCPAH